MMNRLLLYSFSLLSFSSWTQFGAPQIIDDGNNTAGITHMISADFSNNGEQDLVVSQGSSVDQLTLYHNAGNANFSKTTIDQAIDDPITIDCGDFNNDGWTDLIALTQSSGQIYYYSNDNGTLQNRTALGTVQSFGKAFAVADFDNDNDLDFVAIGQHSIDLYRNDGSAAFTMENILTTSSSPNVLECFALQTADINGDGALDLITGETIGLVTYINDGSGNFTAQTVSETQHHTINALNIIDANTDTLPDILFHATSDIGIYLNQSNNSSVTFNFYDTLSTANANTISGFKTGDFTLNAHEDCYFTTEGTAYYIEQTNILDFSARAILHASNSLFIWESHTADITGDSTKELIWAAAGGTIAYHEHQSASSRSSFVQHNAFVIYPTPCDGTFYIDQPQNTAIRTIQLYDLTGKTIATEKSTNGNTTMVHMKNPQTGIYLAQLTLKTGSIVQRRIVVQ